MKRPLAAFSFCFCGLITIPMTLSALLTLESPSKFAIVLVSKGLTSDRAREVPQEFPAAQSFQSHTFGWRVWGKGEHSACSLLCSLLALFTYFYTSHPRYLSFLPDIPVEETSRSSLNVNRYLSFLSRARDKESRSFFITVVCKPLKLFMPIKYY